MSPEAETDIFVTLARELGVTIVMAIYRESSGPGWERRILLRHTAARALTRAPNPDPTWEYKDELERREAVKVGMTD